MEEGRRETSPRDRRTSQISTLVTPEQRKAIRDLAEAQGHTLSSFTRYVLLKALREQKP